MEGKYTGTVEKQDSKFSYSYPPQKIPDSKKTLSWYKKNIDFAERLIGDSQFYETEFNNKTENANLRANIIDVRNFSKYINPGELDLDKFPAKFQHIGIGNAKIDLLIGDYISRKHEYRAFISSSDEEGNTRKEEALKVELFKRVSERLKQPISKEEADKLTQELEYYSTHDFQDIGEKIANAILRRESSQQNFDFLFMNTFEDLLVFGEELMYIDILGGRPVMRRVDCRKVFSSGGGNSIYLHDKDIIVMYDYLSIGQIMDDYWDHLSEADVKTLERRESYLAGKPFNQFSTPQGTNAILINSATDITGPDLASTEDDTIKLIPPSLFGRNSIDSEFNERGEMRVLTTFWKTRRKIGKLTYLDELGEEQITYVNEHYIPNKDEGEKITWYWVNEWVRGTKIGSEIYTKCQPIEHSVKSLVNISLGYPPIVGVTMNTKGYKVQSLMDILKPFDYAYDIGFWKRELEIATFKGTATAVNAALIPSGWKPEEWLHYSTVDKIMFLDPTQEVLKGPAQGKAAGAFNTFITQEVSMGANTQGIQMLTDYLANIEMTMGKIAGVQGAREGEIGNRSAVRNIQTELQQYSKITEKWFQVDLEFKRLCLKKFLEACKIAYKDNPANGAFFLDSMGQEYVNITAEFTDTDFDIHIGDSIKDTQLFNDLRTLAQAAIQNGQATIADLVDIYATNSIQSISRKLKKSIEQLKKEQQEQQEKELQTQQQMQEAELQDKKEERQYKIDKEQKDRESSERIAAIRAQAQLENTKIAKDSDADRDGKTDALEDKKLEAEINYKNKMAATEEQKLREIERHNRAVEENQRNNQRKKP
jgi:hypothetical protein